MIRRNLYQFSAPIRSAALLASLALAAAPTPAHAEWVTRTAATAGASRALAVHPVRNKVYVAQEGDASVLVFAPLTGTSTTVAVQQGPDAIAVDPLADRVYVANQGSASVSVIDGATDAVITTIAVGTEPYAIAVNPVTHRIYVTNRASNTVSVIAGASNTVVQTIPVGGSPQSVAVNPLTNKIYVVNHDTNNVTVINGVDGTTGTVTVGTTPYAVAVNPATNYIYVANYVGNNVTRIDGATNAKVTITTGTRPYALGVNPVTNRIYVANVAANTVTIINGATNGTTTVAAATNPIAVAINTATNRIYVPCLGSTNLTIIDGAAGTTTTLAVGSSGLSVGANPWTGRVYVARNAAAGQNLVEIDGSINTMSTIATGSAPTSVAVNRRTHRAYVANRDGNSVTEVDLATLAPAATIAVGATPVAIVVDELRNRIFTANFTSSSVSVIDGVTRAVNNVSVDIGPQALALDAQSGTVYAGCYWEDSVMRLDGTTLAATSIPMGPGANPVALAVNPVTQACYVANRGTNTVARIEPGGALSKLLCVGASPAGIAVDAATNQVFVANSLGSSLSVIDGTTNALTTVATLAGPVALAVDPDHGQVFAADSIGQALSVVRTSNLSVTNVALGIVPRSIAVNRWTGRAYAAGPASSALKAVDLGSLAVSTLAASSGITGLAADDALGIALVGHAGGTLVDAVRERSASALPLASTIQPLAGDEAQPAPTTFTGTSTASWSPQNTGILGQYVITDSPARPWNAASLTSGSGTPSAGWSATGVDPGPPGMHLIASAALDATSATLDNSSQSEASIFLGAPAFSLYRTRTNTASALPALDPAVVQGSASVVVSPHGEEPFVASLGNAWVSLARAGQTVPDPFPLTQPGGGFSFQSYYECGDRVLSHLANDTLKVRAYLQPDADCGTEHDCLSTVRTAGNSPHLLYWLESDPSTGFYLMNRLFREYWEKRLGVYPELTILEVSNTSDDVRANAGASTGWNTSGTLGVIRVKPGFASFDDVLAHEFGHRMVVKLLHSVLSSDCVNTEGSEARGLDEGIADYFAAAYHGDPNICEGCEGANKPAMRRLVNTQQYHWCSSDPDRNGGYPGSTIPSGALWDLRGVLDNTFPTDGVNGIDRWVYDTILDLAPLSCEQCTYKAFRDKLRARPLNGANVSAQVNAAFAGHGVVDSPVDDCVPRPVVQQIQRAVDAVGQHLTVTWSAVQGTSFYKLFTHPFGSGGGGMGPGELVGDSLTTTQFEHTEADTSLGLAFVVVPYDAAGNPGPSSLETPAVTAVPPTDPALQVGLQLTITPNPAREFTAFRLGSTGERPNDLRIFDVAGRLVRALRPQAQSDGSWAATWDTTDRNGRTVPSGVYLVRNSSGKHAIIRRLIVVK